MPRGLNIELAEKVLKQVTEHPETHNQHEWGYRNSCGTSACLAGWAVYIAHPDAVVQWRTNPYDTSTDQVACSVVPLGGGQRFDIATLAAEALGLDEDDADELFLTLDNEEAIEMLSEWIKEEKRVTATD